MLYLNLLIMQLVIVFILDLSGVMLSIKKTIWKILYGKKTIDLSYKLSLKPFSCSLCMTHHLGLLYLLILGEFTILNYGYICLLAYMTTVSGNLFLNIKDFLTRIINKIQ